MKLYKILKTFWRALGTPLSWGVLHTPQTPPPTVGKIKLPLEYGTGTVTAVAHIYVLTYYSSVHLF